MSGSALWTLPPDGVGPPRVSGMRVRGEIETRRVDGALVVPAEAVFVTATGPVAYRLRGGGLEAVPLTLGARSSRGLQVLSGLAAGDRVSRVDPRVGRR